MLLYMIVFTNLSSFFSSFFSCSVQWHFMLKQWEPPPSTIFSRTTNYFDGGWPLLYKESHDDISHSIHTHTRMHTYMTTLIHITWSSEQHRKYKPVLETIIDLGRCPHSLHCTLLLLRWSFNAYIYVCMFKLVWPHVHVWWHCL